MHYKLADNTYYHWELRLYIDFDNGVTVHDCQVVLKYIDPLLKIEQIVPTSCRLEVSSPGVDKPLFVKEHYLKVIGQEIAIKMRDITFGKKKFRGILDRVSDDKISLIDDQEYFDLPFDKILKANVVSKLDSLKIGKKYYG